MSKLDFTPDEFTQRLARVRQAIQQAGLDWFIAFHPVSIHWLTGSDAKSYQEFQCLFLSAEPGPLRVLTREGEVNEFLADALIDEVRGFGGPDPADPVEHFQQWSEELGLRGQRVGMEVPAYYLHPHHYVRIKEWLGKALLAEPNELIHNLKLVKSPQELAYIRQASEYADRALQRFTQHLAAGRSELELAGEVYHSLLTSGSGLAASPINLVSGPRSCFSHGPPTTRRLEPGDFGSIEYGATCNRYTSTIGRQFCLGPPTPEMQRMYDVVRTACDAQMAAIRAGVPAIVPHEAAAHVIADAGWNKARVHTSGYGLAPGFPPTWGEPLHMFGGSPYTLQAGMVVTIEPPVFHWESRLGARIIDNVLVTETGCELLSRTSRDLIVVA